MDDESGKSTAEKVHEEVSQGYGDWDEASRLVLW